jgi:hypothetical protein
MKKEAFNRTSQFFYIFSFRVKESAVLQLMEYRYYSYFTMLLIARCPS